MIDKISWTNVSGDSVPEISLVLSKGIQDGVIIIIIYVINSLINIFKFLSHNFK